MTEHILHPIPPVFREDSELLILGSFPSVKSREAKFYYGHPQNRFWKVMECVFADAPGETVPERKAFLLRHHIALWDVIRSCDITGSSDASIQNAEVNDLSQILKAAEIRTIFVNGRKAETLYRRCQEPHTGIRAICLPSTSPANAAWSLERLTESWRILLSAGKVGPAIKDSAEQLHQELK